MPASPIESLLRLVINQWIDDPDLSVEYAEMVETQSHSETVFSVVFKE